MSEICPIWLKQETMEEESMSRATEIVSRGWKNIEYIPDASSFKDVSFSGDMPQILGL